MEVEQPMTSTRITVFETWSDYRRTLLDDVKLLRQGAAFGYRGVANADWGLVSSIDRQFAGFSETRLRQVATSMGADFGEMAIHWGLPRGTPIHDVLAVGQHHGLPTRLLDWTSSPYIAAYFAFASLVRQTKPGNRLSDGRVAVWRLRADHVIFDRTTDITPGPVELHRAHPELTPRLYSQKGLFTINHRGGDLAEVLDELGLLTKAVLPGTSAHEALADLDLMGINDAAMFPDLSGVAMSAVTRAAVRISVDGQSV